MAALLSTLAVAEAFLDLTKLIVDERNLLIANWVLHQKMTLRIQSLPTWTMTDMSGTIYGFSSAI